MSDKSIEETAFLIEEHLKKLELLNEELTVFINRLERWSGRYGAT